jgi:hypothetical protein
MHKGRTRQGPRANAGRLALAVALASLLIILLPTSVAPVDGNIDLETCLALEFCIVLEVEVEVPVVEYVDRIVEVPVEVVREVEVPVEVVREVEVVVVEERIVYVEVESDGTPMPKPSPTETVFAEVPVESDESTTVDAGEVDESAGGEVSSDEVGPASNGVVVERTPPTVRDRIIDAARSLPWWLYVLMAAAGVAALGIVSHRARLEGRADSATENLEIIRDIHKTED